MRLLLCDLDFGKLSHRLLVLLTNTLIRNYVATFWPLDPSPPGSQLEGMYVRILKAKEDAKNAPPAAAAASNEVKKESATA